MKDIQSFYELFNTLKIEMNNGSDRACVIVAAAFLDDMLKTLIQNFLTLGTYNQDRELFDSNGPLSTFSSKIKMAYRLGLISEFEYKALECLKRIRNDFAHDVLSKNLEDGSFKDRIIQVKPKRELIPCDTIPFLNDIDGKSVLPIDMNINGGISNNVESKIIKHERLPKIPTIDDSSVKDMFVKTTLSLVNSLSARLMLAAFERRKTPSMFNNIYEITNTQVEVNKNLWEDFIDRANNLKETIDNQIEEVLEHSKKMDKESPNSKDAEKLLLDLINERDACIKEIERVEESKNKMLLLNSILSYSACQIKKALEKEGLL